MSKKIVLIVFFMCFLLLNIKAQENKREIGEPRMGPPPFVEELNLSKEQADKFKSINLQKEESLIDIKYQIEKKQLEFKKELIDKPSKEKILKINSDLNDLHKKIRESEINNWFLINDILDSAQKEVWSKHLMMLLDGPNRLQKGQREKMGKREFREFRR
ncbi:MAG: hypothetical protein V1773_08985 [bacterium]